MNSFSVGPNRLDLVIRIEECLVSIKITSWSSTPQYERTLDQYNGDVFIHLIMMGAEQVRKRILECPGVGPGGSFNASFSYKKLFPLAHRWLDEEIKRKGKGTSTLGERSTTERKLYSAFGKDESLLKKNLLILFQLVDWIVSQVQGFTSWARSLVQV
jgi:hypothetical protein